MDATRKLSILSFSSLYPNAEQPRHGVFVEERLRHLLATGEIGITVVAPVPWFPSRNPRFGHYARLAAVPGEEVRHGLRVLHPRYPVVPKVGMTIAPGLMAAAMLPVLRRMLASGEHFDLIDAHYFYPDGVAAVWLGERLGKPVVVTSRGTDVNWIPRYRGPRAQLRWAAARASGLISVSQALGEHLVQLGVSRERITVLRNGVDLQAFQPVPAAAETTRQELHLPANVPLLLSVGSLIERKGHHTTLEALTRLPDAVLVVAGEGPLKPVLHRQMEDLGLAPRVRFLGPIPHKDLPRYYSAADVSVLASSREGMPNVVLEALACGTPVVACDAEGVSEVLADPVSGRVVPAREPEALARCVESVLSHPPGRERVREYAQRFSWDETSAGQLKLFREISRERECTEA
ncbi:glycosyl transferase family 1 [Acidihalobacter aeolianus]|uniref:Glycosyl transferase family 1 n=1 Tax=Acidihalobacter aeolianus TaxID=2792603 RepID=A0A1D8K779_9GAMM|nr:glycosyltransferase family 4 protein [Acidihalobacter aeolianus]AOV16823.1 glycosyl transferase family 1 [Acidihalobacter aeolianus]